MGHLEAKIRLSVAVLQLHRAAMLYVSEVFRLSAIGEIAMMRPKYRVLGGFRLLLALCVVLSHTWGLTFGTERHFIWDIGMGNFAVMGFFVLSGFIIAEAVDVFYANRAGAFVANRFLRLVPAYWAAVIFSVIVHIVLYRAGILRFTDYDAAPAVMFTLDNMLVQITAIIPVINVNKLLPRYEWYYFVRFAWAIFVEFAFYLSVAICMVAWPIARRVFSLTAYVALCASAFLAIHLVNELVRPLHDTFRFVPYFTLGVAIYGIMTRRSRTAWCFAVLSYVLVAIHFTRYTQGQLPFYADWWSGLSKPVVLVPTAIMLAIPLLMVALAKLGVSKKATRFDKWLGDLSYPIYLNHYAVLIAVLSLFPSPSWAVQATAFVASIIVSLVLKNLVEQPLTLIRDKLRGARLDEPASKDVTTVDSSPHTDLRRQPG